MRRSTVVIELAGDAALTRDLAAGGVFVPDCTLRIAEECDLVVCGANRRISFPARVVYVDQRRGAGLELIGFSTAMRQQIAELTPVAASANRAEPTHERTPIAADDDDDLAIPHASEADDAYRTSEADDAYRTVPRLTRSESMSLVSFESEPAGDDYTPPVSFEPGPADDLGMPVSPLTQCAPPSRPDFVSPASIDPGFIDEGCDADATDDDGAPFEPRPDTRDGDDTEDTDEPIGESGSDFDASEAGPHQGSGSRGSRSMHERLRGLTLAAQTKLATNGEIHERIVLERLYGKNVWETLLRNPRLTAAEVSRIARYGALPRVLLELILGNNAWLQVPEVRRALLSNPRLGTDQIMKVLRLVPKHELRLAAIQTGYPHAVRNAAKILMRGD